MRNHQSHKDIWKELYDAFPAGSIITSDHKSFERYVHSTSTAKRSILAVVTVDSVSEIRTALQIATKNKVGIYPISTGKNWGYGTAFPVREENIILDLSSMNRILHVDSDLAYAVIEPGVTQQDLHDYLVENNIPLRIDPTGAGPTCSLLGNTLDRGYGLSRYGDHFAHQCGMEVILADGEVVKTGFGSYEHSKVDHLYKWGVGPYTDGLFTQSNLGVVTKIGVWLQPKPESLKGVYFSISRTDDFLSLVDTVRDLMLREVLLSGVNILERTRLILSQRQYPWELSNDGRPLSAKQIEEMMGEPLPKWGGLTSIYGTESQVQTAQQVITERMLPYVDSIDFIAEEDLEHRPQYQASFELIAGTPTETFLQLAYWRNRRKNKPRSGADPALDGCGLIWIAPIIPATAADISHYLEIVEPIFSYLSLDFAPTFTTINPRSIACTQPILFDRDDQDNVRRAQECYEVVSKECIKKGYIPYRLGIHAMEKHSRQQNGYWKMVSKIKGALDPEGILAPGRYSL